MLGAIALTGLLALMTIPAATDGAVFLAFIQQVLVPALRPGQVVVFDNLSPQNITSGVFITGLKTNEHLINIDFRPGGSPTGQLYGIGSSLQVYTNGLPARNASW